MTDLNTKRVAFVATDGFEDSELTSPWQAVLDAGGTAVLVAPESGEIEGKNGHRQPVDLTTSEAAAADFDALVLPGGTGNADHLRMDEPAVDLTRGFIDAGKPIAAICHAAWTLIEADGVRDRTVTSFPSLKTDLRNAGATWVDQEVVVDGSLITSRTPDDLDAFNAALVERFAQA